ncbi:RluA family pseudouridine synthase [Gordoniibacillus kamchatkensis]|uniref:RluA family pseudouridine synthase n=1 Tax=Gordoniibacillus kamchatkensis TaxID=1590651 RepID=UPI0009E2BF10
MRGGPRGSRRAKQDGAAGPGAASRRGGTAAAGAASRRGGTAAAGAASRSERAAGPGDAGKPGRAAKSGAAGKPQPPRSSGDKSYTVDQPAELLAFLLETVANRGRNSIKSMLARGQIEVNERAVTAYNYPLQSGDIVTVRKQAAVETIPLAGMAILHEDEDIVVILKEAGLLSIAASREDDELTAYRQLTAHVRQTDPNGRIFVVHRLDRDTSGVMMFAKSEQVQQQLQTGWQDVVQERTYVALVEGMVRKPEGRIESWLKETKTLKMYSSPHPNDGQHAVTHYKTLRANRDFSLLEVQLETGRKNQIRVHLSDIGHPIVGDKKYGSRSRAIGRLGLHARVLAFLHPRTGEPMRFATDIPKALLRPFQ